MHEGAFRILKALGTGAELNRSELVRKSGEASSVVDDVLTRYAKWFVVADGVVACSEQGFAALGREMVAREPVAKGDGDAAWRALAARRPTPKRELDQVYATEESVMRRAALLIEEGELQRGLIFLGDDDLTSAAVALRGQVDRPVTVVDVDDDMLSLLEGAGAERGVELRTLSHDLREPLPRKLRERFGCVFTDPPYAVEGFSLFVSRAIELLKPDGRLYVCFGHSRRASERGLAKQRVLSDAGLLVERVFDDFTEYDGAESIGGRSALWVCRRTPQTKPLVTGVVEGPLYTSREPGT